MIEIEFNEPKIFSCECCGEDSTTLTRYVHQDGNAHAVYHLSFTKNHPMKSATGVISIGEWGVNHIPEQRYAFPFEIRVDEDQYQIGLMNKDTSPWIQHEILGKFLDRDEALQHKWIKEVFHITDHIIAEDTELKNYFES